MCRVRTRFVRTTEEWGSNYKNNDGDDCFLLSLMQVAADTEDGEDSFRITAKGTGGVLLFKDMPSYDSAVYEFGTIPMYSTKKHLEVTYGFQRW